MCVLHSSNRPSSLSLSGLLIPTYAGNGYVEGALCSAHSWNRLISRSVRAVLGDEGLEIVAIEALNRAALGGVRCVDPGMPGPRPGCR